MFGKEYANHVDVLIQSFGQMNAQYRKKIKISNYPSLIVKLKKLYVYIFGIPEIGFQIRSMYFRSFISSYLAKKNFKKILDAGSGIGIYTFLLAKTFPQAKVTGIDIDKKKLKSCIGMARKLQNKNVEFIYYDVTKIRERALYDLIVSVDVLEHLNDYESVLKNFFELLRKDGYLYIHVPQPNQKRIFSSFRTWHHEDHTREGILKTQLEKSFRKLGFKIVASKYSFGLFGKLSWELHHLMLSKNFILAGITFPFLFILGRLDLFFENKDGLGTAILVMKR